MTRMDYAFNDEADEKRRFWRDARVPGTPCPIEPPWGGCERCAFKELCAGGACCACESVQVWEDDEVARVRG